MSLVGIIHLNGCDLLWVLDLPCCVELLDKELRQGPVHSVDNLAFRWCEVRHDGTCTMPCSRTVIELAITALNWAVTCKMLSNLLAVATDI